MISKRRVASIGIVLVCASLLGYVGKSLHDLNRRLKCEYATAGVIREVTEYVKLHEGQLPRGWTDLPEGEHASQYVKMRFEMNIHELMDDPARIHTYIVPLSGDYHIYPHAERQLDELREVLEQHYHSEKQ